MQLQDISGLVNRKTSVGATSRTTADRSCVSNPSDFLDPPGYFIKVQFYTLGTFKYD